MVRITVFGWHEFWRDGLGWVQAREKLGIGDAASALGVDEVEYGVRCMGGEGGKDT